MQKAVHDIDYMFYLADSSPVEVCAMRDKLYHVGDKAYDLSCDKCPQANTCIEGPFMKFYKHGLHNSVPEAMEKLSNTVTSENKKLRKKYCVFSKDIAIEDVSECIILMKNGIHISHSQNFIANYQACRRGCRICGSLASMEIDFITSKITLMSHMNKSTEEYYVDQGTLSHYGGDRELVLDFLKTIKTGEPGRSDMIHGSGITSTLACLCARESADTHRFIKIELSDL